MRLVRGPACPFLLSRPGPDSAAGARLLSVLTLPCSFSQLLFREKGKRQPGGGGEPRDEEPGKLPRRNCLDWTLPVGYQRVMTKLFAAGRLLIGLYFLQSNTVGAEVVVAFDPVDCTANLQAAFNGPADSIRIPNVGQSWVTGPLTIGRSNVTLLLEPGVELLAKLGAFGANGACLVQVRSCQNIVIRGYGATLRMQAGAGSEYQQFRNHHCLELLAVNNFLAEGLYITKAGTDGIFISGGLVPAEATFSNNVTIRDCDMDDNSRQGISVISAQDLLVERSVMRNTGVTSQDLPMAGIDFEPDLPTQRLVRCTVRDCLIFGNNGPTYSNGILTATLNLRTSSEPVSLTFERCHVTSTRNTGHCVNLSGPPDNVGPLTTMTMTDCLIEDSRGIGLFINSGAAKTRIQLTRTVIRNTYTDPAAWGGAPIFLEGQDRDLTAYGNITFTDCFLSDNKPRPFLRSFEDRAGLANSFCDGLRGNITVVNPNPSGQVLGLDSPGNDQNITLNIDSLSTPPTQNITFTDLQPAGYEGTPTNGPAITRTATNKSFPLAVNLSWTGTAQNRTDYGFQPDFVILPPGAAQANLGFTARKDELSEGEETVVVTALAHPADYTVNSAAANATVRVFDTPLPAWRFNQFRAAVNSGISANEADPDSDGISNLREYALGSLPLDPASAVQPVAGLINGRLSLSYPRQAWSDLTYTVEASTNLATWPVVIQTSTGGENVAETVVATAFPSLGNEPRLFLRLRLSTP
jgi:Right handed beta helix region